MRSRVAVLSEAGGRPTRRGAGLAATVHGPKSQDAGTMATYEIQVSNPGNASAQDVVVSAELPAGAAGSSAIRTTCWGVTLAAP